MTESMGTKRVGVLQIAVPLGLAIVIALAALSYVGTRALISKGPQFAAPGTKNVGSAFVVEWRTGDEIGIVATFVPSRRIRIRSVTLDGLDPKDTYVESAEYGFWDGRSSLPSFRSETDTLPQTLHPRLIEGSFTAPARSTVFVHLIIRAIADAKATSQITGMRVDGESWAWAHTTLLPFPEPVVLQRPR